MAIRKRYDIDIHVVTEFLNTESEPESGRFVFSYTITILNKGEIGAQLISRHWYITDANGQVKEVCGAGVVGEQPHLFPGERFCYTSGAVLPTPVGSMHGSYQMKAENGEFFDVTIPAFRLAVPTLVH